MQTLCKEKPKTINNKPLDVKTGDICPLCKKGILHRVVKKENFIYGIHMRTISEFISYDCNECNEIIIPIETFERVSPIIRSWVDEIKRKEVDIMSKV